MLLLLLGGLGGSSAPAPIQPDVEPLPLGGSGGGGDPGRQRPLRPFRASGKRRFGERIVALGSTYPGTRRDPVVLIDQDTGITAGDEEMIMLLMIAHEDL